MGVPDIRDGDGPDCSGDGESLNIREIIGGLLGERLLDITQEIGEPTPKHTMVHLHFGNGSTLSFPISTDGFDYETLD